MKASKETSEQAVTAEARLAFALIVGVTAFGGAVMGLILVFAVGELLNGLLGFRPRWWLGLLGGVSLGTLVGYFQASVVVKRLKQFANQASELGLQCLSNKDVESVERQVGRMLPRQDFRTWNAYFRKNDTVQIVLADSGIGASMGSSSSDSKSRELQQTCCYLEFKDLMFPDFVLQPEGVTTNIMSKMAGGFDVDIDFSDSPAFSGAYLLSGGPDETVRKLFSQDCRDFFADNRGWTVRAKNNRLVIYQLKAMISVNELRQFLADCLEIAGKLQASGVEIPAVETRVTMTREIALSQANAMGGLLGALFKRTVERTALDVDEVAKFIDQPTPRRVPVQLKNQFAGDVFLYGFGFVFMLAGFVLSLFGWLGDGPQLANYQSILLAIGVALICLGIAIVWAVRAFSQAKLNLLVNGRVRLARIEKVIESSFVNGNQRVFNVQLQMLDGTCEQICGVKVQGGPAQIAINKSEANSETRVFQDPKNPNRIIMIECYAVQ